METIPTRPLAGSMCLVTGAAGFVGQHLVDALVARGCRVRAFDRIDCNRTDAQVTSIVGDVTRRAEVDRAMEGVDTVFHAAARIVLTEHTPRPVRDAVYAVNVEGTRNVVESAIAAGAARLCHTSTQGVVFGPRGAGQDESLPYSRHKDIYSITKIAAEKLVLDANGRGGLLTAALRPGGIHGPGERNMFLRPILGSIRRGEPVVVIGDGRSKMDYTFVDNLVDAELRAAERLVPGSRVAGQAYFISDGQPINHGEWPIRLLKRMGIPARVRKIPGGLLTIAATGMELLYKLRGRPEPLITKTNVQICVHDSWYSIEKARRDLGYAPLYDTWEGIDRSVDDALAFYRSLPAPRGR